MGNLLENSVLSLFFPGVSEHLNFSGPFFPHPFSLDLY